MTMVKLLGNAQVRSLDAAPGYSVIVAQTTGVLCKSCGEGIEVDDEYIRGIRGAEIAASLYRHFHKHFPRSVDQGHVASATRPWQKILTCGHPRCGKTHAYKADDLRLYDY